MVLTKKKHQGEECGCRQFSVNQKKLYIPLKKMIKMTRPPIAETQLSARKRLAWISDNLMIHQATIQMLTNQGRILEIIM